jgi:hypothetical protein
MAVIGHAEVIVTPITKGFEAALRRDLGRMNGMLGSQGRRAGQSMGDALQEGMARSMSNNIFGRLSDGLRNMAPEAEMARERFQSLVRVGYVLQGIIGPLVGGISSLVVSLGTLVGVLAKAAPAAAALATAFVTLRVAAATAKFGFGDIASAVKQATQPTNALGKSIAELREEFQQLQFDAEQANQSEARAALNLEDALNNLKRVQDLPPNSRARREAQLAYEEAETAYARAKDRAADLNEVVGEGQDAYIQKNKEAAGTDPFANLNEAQRDFAEFLVTLQPKIDALELSISRALLPPLREAVEILEDELYPILERELPVIAGEVGEAIKGIFNDTNYERVESILKGMTTPFGDNELGNIDLFGELLGNILDIFMQIVEGATPLLNDFLTWAVGKTEDWSDALEKSDLVGFFGEAGGVAGRLGGILGNVFTGIGNLAELTTGPGSAGDMMLSWMEKSTETFANMFSEDPEAGKKFFADAFANAQSVMSSIGALLEEILKLADNPNIGLTFDKLKEGAPAVGEMLGKMIDAGPSFAEFIKTVTEIANKLTDDDQISAFFKTLNDGAQRFNEFLDSDAAKKLLDNLGPVFATLSALGVIFDVIRFAANVAIGYFAFVNSGIGKVFSPIVEIFKGPGSPLAKAAALLRGPLIIGAILFVISKAMEFYNKFEDFRARVDAVFGDVKASFERMMEPIKELFEKVFGGENGGGLISALDPVIKLLLEFLIPALGGALNEVMNVITFVAELANNLLDFVLPIVTSVADAIGDLFSGDFAGFFTGIFDALKMIIPGIVQFVINTIIDMINFIIRRINNFVGSIANTPFGGFLKDVMGLDLSGFNINELQKVDWLGDMTTAQNQRDLRQDAAKNGMGSDRRLTQSSLGGNLDNYAKSSIQQQSGWKDYMDGGLTINQTNNINAKDVSESVSIADRMLADGVRRGMG